MEQNSFVTVITVGLVGRAWQSVRSLSCELHVAGGRLWHVGNKPLLISFCPQSRFSVIVGPAPPVKQQEAGFSHRLFCGLWFRHTHFSTPYNSTHRRLRLKVYFRRGREGMRGLHSYFRSGCSGVRSGSLVRLLIDFGCGALLVSVVLRLLVSLLAGSSEPYIRAVWQPTSADVGEDGRGMRRDHICHWAGIRWA